MVAVSIAGAAAGVVASATTATLATFATLATRGFGFATGASTAPSGPTGSGVITGFFRGAAFARATVGVAAASESGSAGDVVCGDAVRRGTELGGPATRYVNVLL
jgi:hypothetical protein